MKSGPVLIALVVLTLGISVFTLATRPDPTAPNWGAPSDGDAEALARIDDRLSRIEKRLDTLSRTARERPVTRVGSNAGGAAAGDPAVEPGATSAGDAAAVAAIEEAVTARVEETLTRMSERQQFRNDDGEWQPPIDVLSRSLELTEAQSEALTGVFDGARDEAFALLRTEYPDGSSVLGDLADDLVSGKGEEAAVTRLFVRLTTEEVPGRNQTYMDALGEAGERIREQATRHMTPAQAAEFEKLRVDVFDVDTGYDPIEQYVLERMGERE